MVAMELLFLVLREFVLCGVMFQLTSEYFAKVLRGSEGQYREYFSGREFTAILCAFKLLSELLICLTPTGDMLSTQSDFF